jgi:hypothetical protein
MPRVVPTSVITIAWLAALRLIGAFTVSNHPHLPTARTRTLLQRRISSSWPERGVRPPRQFFHTTALAMVRGVKKENLPQKVCVVCQRPFTWRKKWEDCWEEVSTCSKSCNGKRRSAQQAANRLEVTGRGGGDAVGDDPSSRVKALRVVAQEEEDDDGTAEPKKGAQKRANKKKKNNED